MLYIKKGREPAELVQAKRDGLIRYEEMSKDAKTAIQQSLLSEQGCLCAYCMKRIKLSNLQIEHYIAQHPTDGDYDPALTIDYGNMLGVCSGNKFEAGSFENLTCDQHRKNTELTVNPLDKRTIDKIGYKSDGTIYSEDIDVQKDLDETLNLNCPASLLKENRKEALLTLQKNLYKNFPNRKAPKEKLERMLEAFETPRSGRYTEFIGILVWYLNRQIARS